MPRFMFWVGLGFALIGIAMAFATYFALTSSSRLMSEGIRTEGTVIDLTYRRNDEGGGSYAPVVEFHDQNGQRQIYRSTSSSNPPAHNRGEKVVLYYLEGTPERAMIDSFTDRWLLPLITGTFAVILGGIGFMILFVMVRRWQRIRWLKAYGEVIEATFERSFLDTSTRVNGRSPWRVEASGWHPATERTEHFVSEQIWTNLGETLDGKTVRVLVDPSSARDHYVDLSRYLHRD